MSPWLVVAVSLLGIAELAALLAAIAAALAVWRQRRSGESDKDGEGDEKGKEQR